MGQSMTTELTHPATDLPQSDLPYNATFTPEFMAVAALLKRTEEMQELSVDLLRQEKITQAFLRSALTTIVDAYFDLEEKTTAALQRAGIYAAETRDATMKADLALRASDTCREMLGLLPEFAEK